MGEQWQKLKDLFIEASEMPEADRDEFLKRSCGDDLEMLEELASLLSAHQETKKLIDNGIDLAEVLGTRTDQVGRKFGNFTIISEIGRGGMGAVFLAERSDGQFRQKVALKIIGQTVADAETARRFRREREILASLNHPNIARLYDGGVSDNDEPFFAMEYVDGSQLLDYARDNNLTIDDRLRLFLKIAATVDYAHQNLTVHRDLKPSNILVTTEGEPKLLDFGLAKLLDENLNDVDRTETQFRAFTLAYASPEQISGKNITTSTDVYSLGVVLYELLTDRKPFDLDKKSLAEVINTVNTLEPLLPSRIAGNNGVGPKASKLKGDIDNILMMALRKEPSRRYRSVGAFAEDVDRYLKGKPVIARPNTGFYRLAKFIGRNRVAVSAAAIVITALIGSLIASLWQARIARIERDRAQRHFQSVRQLSNSLLFEITPKIESLEGSTEAREMLVKRALDYLDNLSSEAGDDDGLKSELAAAYEKVGDLQGNPGKPNLSDFAGAIESYKKANVIWLSLPQTLQNRHSLADNYRLLSGVKSLQNDTPGSLADLEQALHIYSELVAEDPDSVDLLHSNIRGEIDMSQEMQVLNKYKESIEHARSALKIAEKLPPDDPKTIMDVSTCLADLAYSLSWDGHQEEAEQAIKKAVVNGERLYAESPEDTVVNKFFWRILFTGSVIYEEVDDKVSFGYAERALPLATRSLEKDDADLQAKQNLARNYNRLGVESVNLNRPVQAVGYLGKAEEILNDLIKREPKNKVYQKDLSLVFTRVGRARLGEKQYDGALTAFQQVIEICEKLLTEDPENTNPRRDIAMAKKNIADVYMAMGNVARSHENNQAAYDILSDLKSKNLLGDADNKTIADLQTALEKQ